jgi:hypothetical protein
MRRPCSGRQSLLGDGEHVSGYDPDVSEAILGEAAPAGSAGPVTDRVPVSRETASCALLRLGRPRNWQGVRGGGRCRRRLWTVAALFRLAC